MKINLVERQVARPGSIGAPMQNPAAAGIADQARADAMTKIAGEAAQIGYDIRKARVAAEVSQRLSAAQKEHTEFFIERSSRPDQFGTLTADNDKALAKVRERALEGMDDQDGRELLGSRLDDYALDKSMQAAGVARKQEIEYSDQQTRLSLENNRSVMGNTTNPKEHDRIRSESKATLDAQVAAGVYSRPVADQIWNKFVSVTQVDVYERLIMADPYTAQKLLKSKEPIEGIDVSTRGQLLRGAQAEVNRIEAAREESIRLEVKDAVYALEHGYMPPNIDAVMSAAKGTEYEAELGRDRAIVEKSVEFARLDPASQRQTIDSLKSADSLNSTQIRYLTQVEKIHDKQQKQLKEDPAQLAVDTGIVREQSPLDFNDEEKLLTGLKTAKINYETQRKVGGYGDKAAPLLASDVFRLQEFLAKAPSDKRAMALGLMAKELDTAFSAAMRQIYDKGSVLPAVAGEIIAAGDTRTGELILTGQKTIEHNKEILPKGEDLSAGIQAGLGGAYAASPQHHAAMADGVRAAYAGLSQLEGDLSGILDPSRLDRAVASVTGGLVEFGDQILPPPERGIDSDRFAGWIDGLIPDNIEAMGGVAGFEDAAALELIRERGRLVATGSGRYSVVVMGLNELPEPLYNNAGKKFELDWSKRDALPASKELKTDAPPARLVD